MPRLLHALFLALVFLIGIPTASADVVVTYFHNDISGSPMLATDAAGNVVWKESYRPYGDKLRNEPASRNGTNKIGYAGSPFDASTGLSYMGARYYDPVIGRFMGIDPVGFQEDNVHSFNRYAYANNNPYRYIDPDGRMAFIPWLMAAAEAAVVRGITYLAPRQAAAVMAAEVGAGVATGAATGGISAAESLAAKGITNTVPSTMARVIPNGTATKTLGRPGVNDVFVTGASDIAGMSSKQIAQRLTIAESPTGFKVIEFATPSSGVASPVFRSDAGFIGGGRTAGGAREFVIPNGSIPTDATIRTVP